MNREERHALLGPAVIAHIHELVDAAPEPTADVVEKLRRIMTNPGGEVPASRPLAPAADAA